jgi:hypothetical protein
MRSPSLYLTPSDPAAQPAIRLMRAAFPSYHGRQFKICVTDTVCVSSYWDGGSKDSFVFVDLETAETSRQVPPQSAFDPVIPGAEAVTLPAGAGCVEHTIYRGKDLGLSLHLSPANATKMLPDPDPVSDDESTVLQFTATYKNTYGGRTNIRFAEAAEETGITHERWSEAVRTLTARKLLNKAGSITPAGRNAATRQG